MTFCLVPPDWEMTVCPVSILRKVILGNDPFALSCPVLESAFYYFWFQYQVYLVNCINLDLLSFSRPHKIVLKVILLFLKQESAFQALILVSRII